MDEISKAMESLKVEMDQRKLDLCQDAILEILDNEDLDHDTTTKSLLEQGILPELSRILRTTTDRTKTAQVIAELAKTEEARSPCVTEGLVPELLALLKTDNENLATAIQACRALGNICFDNDVARNAVAEEGGVQTVVELMQRSLLHTAESAARLRTVVCGLLLNLTNTHETVQEKAVSLGAMETLKQYLGEHATHEQTVHMALLSVGSLADSEPGKAQLLTSGVLIKVVHLIGTEVGDNLQDAILDLLTNLSENDDKVKVSLSQSDLPERLLCLLQRSASSDSEDDRTQTEKMVTDLIVLLLTGDQSMEVLYGAGEGPLYKETLHWLQSDRDQLKMSAALAIGNFARNDSHCLHLVSDGLTDRLLSLLSDHGAGDSEPTLQHAVFSALRNLAIPAANKPVMLQSGLIHELLSHVNTEFSSVQFTLLGTLRMVIDKQEDGARVLGTNEDFLQRLVTWCSVEEHAGVKGEANRLVAWLIKHSHSSEVMALVCKHRAVPHLVNMALSEHQVMQNEALVALTLMASSVLEPCSASFTQADLVPTIKVLLTDKDTVPEILCNVLTLVRVLAQSVDILKLMKTIDLHKIIRDLQKHESSIVSKAAKESSSLFGKG